MEDTGEWKVVSSKSHARKSTASTIQERKDSGSNQDKNKQGSSSSVGGQRVQKGPQLVKSGPRDRRGAANSGNQPGVAAPGKVTGIATKQRTGNGSNVVTKVEINKSTSASTCQESRMSASCNVATTRAVNSVEPKAERSCGGRNELKNVASSASTGGKKPDFDAKVQSTSDSNREKNQAQLAQNTTVPNKPKKKRGGTKDERRKKREEKFFQALYQNKDSHIQFVSAEVIRKLQSNGNDRRLTASPKPQSSRTAGWIQSSNLQAPLGEPSTTAKWLPVDDFPTLTSNDSSIVQQKNILDKPSCSFIEKSESPIKTQQANTEISGKNKCKQDDVSPPVDLLNETPKSEEKSTTTPACTAKGRKSKQPMIIDVSSLIINKKKERERDMQKKLVASSMPFKTGILRKENFKVTAGNPLDSSGPGMINRGKIRQKKKKPTKLKLTILKSRALHKILVEQQIKQEAESLQNDDNTVETNTFPIKVEKPSTSDDSATDLPLSDGTLSSNVKDEPDIGVKQDNTTSDETCLNQSVEMKCEVSENLENTNSHDNMTLKFIKLLDEVSRLKNSDERPTPEIEIRVKSSMHNRKFRDYCDMYTSKDLHRYVMSLLSELFRFQDRLYHTDPIKFKTKRRFVTGLKEAFCYLNLNKVQLLIIAPDIEKNPEPGGLDEKITQILNLANAKGVPYVFSSCKYNLGKPMRIKTPISIISVLDKQNCEETFRALMEEASQLRERYHNDFVMKTNELMQNSAPLDSNIKS